MPVIHMDTENVRSAAGQLQQDTDALRQLITSLNGRIQSMGWEGSSSEGYRSNFMMLKNRVQTACNQCEALSLRLNREVDEWLRVDQGGPSRLLPDPSAWEDIKRGVRDLFVLLIPYSLQEGFEELLNTPAGEQEIEQAINEHVRFVIKGDGSFGYQGDDATIIEIDWGGGVGSGRYGNGKIFVDDDVLSRMGNSRKGLSELLGHEMQHALDDKNHLFVDTASDADLNNFQNLTPAQQRDLSSKLGNDIQSHIDSEIRAYERSDAIEHGHAYQDDGINSGAERQAILNHQLDSGTYESYYEKMLAKNYPGLEFDLWIDANGKTQINILQVPPTPTPPTPVPTPTPPIYAAS